MPSATRLVIVISTILLALSASAQAQVDSGPAALAKSYRSDIRPLLKAFCFECHAGDRTEADIDLSAFVTSADATKQIEVWLKIREVLNTNQMPPKDAKRPSGEQHGKLKQWTRRFLTAEAAARAGDPGPVVLRRLSNAEYNYTIRDLTGVASLEPTREFPIDGAAGEGFTNTGNAQAMSPSLLGKYLEAAKGIATHAVLAPGGIEFSRHTTRRDHTNERLARIQSFYRRFTAGNRIADVNLPGVRFTTKQEGLLPVKQYLDALLQNREAIANGEMTLSDVASEERLNSRYLTTLWTALNGEPRPDTMGPLNQLKQSWRAAKKNDAGKLTAEIDRWRNVLWKFNSIGQFGKQGGPQAWMEGVDRIVDSTQIQLDLAGPSQKGDVTFFLAASGAGDGSDSDFAIWDNARIEFKPREGKPTRRPIPLHDIRATTSRTRAAVSFETRRTADYLNAVAELHQSTKKIDEFAKQRKLDARLLQRWARFVDMKFKSKREISGHLRNRITRSHGKESINGWGESLTPSLLSNRSNEPVSFLTLTIPARSVVVHPTPTRESVVAWRSPLDGKFTIKGLVADADDKCGNGASWRLELLNTAGRMLLAGGSIDNGRKESFSVADSIEIEQHDVVLLMINARNKSHVCDTTHVELSISEESGKKRTWGLAKDCVDRVLQANPLADSYGNEETWHFCATADNAGPKPTIAAGSTLARWRSSALKGAGKQSKQLALAVQTLLTTQDPQELSESDRELRRQLLDWSGPLNWLAVETNESNIERGDEYTEYGVDPARFGRHPKDADGAPVGTASLCVKAPNVLRIKLPAELARNAQFVATGRLHRETGAEGSVQMRALRSRPTSGAVYPTDPFIASENSGAHHRIESSLDAFRNLFPAALCYARIVPVDEVVTLTLFFREDHTLQTLMLSPDEIAELDDLWDDLFYVSREPIALTVAYEQLVEFATQDRPDLVKSLAPLRQPINNRADKFRKRLVDTEPRHLAAVIEFADRAWRRPLCDSERANIRMFYRQLRRDKISHEMAIQLSIARVLTSPSFLYRQEEAPEGRLAATVSNAEIANRLSFFLWSSMPDAKLREIAEAGDLKETEELKRQTSRMLSDPRTRRLAIQFACQWLHLRDFDRNDNKNEELYPEFVSIRSDMYEETVRFFEDLFRNDGSILDLLDADHTFVNGEMAKHYGLTGISGPEWRRVEGVREKQRGGILTMATLLASQSGASRTSPILRGNWISETLLGERLPRPPANVPQLPEKLPSGLTARQLIERHSAVPGCATCHDRIDPLGFALEQYDAIGRLRPERADTKTKLFDGTVVDGANELRNYLVNRRRDDVVRQFCRKLLGFALGREVQLSDELLLDEMAGTLKANQFRFSVAVEAIVTSRQFRDIRGRDAAMD